MSSGIWPWPLLFRTPAERLSAIAITFFLINTIDHNIRVIHCAKGTNSHILLSMATLSLEQIRATIFAMNANWEAGETEISKFVDEPGGGLFGLSMGEQERAAAIQEAAVSFAAPVSAPPPAVDWRNLAGCDWITAVKAQGFCGACVSFATCAVLEARLRWFKKDCSLVVDLSEADLFFCGCGSCCSSGWNFVPALTYCQTRGVGPESAFPYTPGNKACIQITPVVKVAGWATHAILVDRKAAIANNGPVIAGMRVYEDFYYYRSGVYRHVGGIFKGLHAVAVVGYDDADDCWIIKNSWGLGWGEKGFARIARGECGIDTQYPFYDPDVVDLNPGGLYL